MDLLKILKEDANNKEFRADNYSKGQKITIEGKSMAPITYYHTYIIEIDDKTNEKYWECINSTRFNWP